MKIAREKIQRTPDEMANFLSQHLGGLFKQYKIDFAYLGGSWARNQNQWWSDLDIFISISHFLSLASRDQLNFLTKFNVSITELTKIEEVDISIIEILPLHVQFKVISEGILIFEQTREKRIQFIEYLLPRFYDHMIWYKRLLHESKYISKEKVNK